MRLRLYQITSQFINHNICLRWLNNPIKYKFKTKFSIIFWSSKLFKIYIKYKLYNQDYKLITLQILIVKTTKYNIKIKLLSKLFKINLQTHKNLKIPLFIKKRILNKT
jgi:hypothetical protein